MLVFAALCAAAVAGAEDASSPPEPAKAVAASARPLVVVLPFEVHSGRDIQYLGESLPSLLAARLEATAKVQAVDPSQAEETLGKAVVPDLQDDRLREVAAKFGAVGTVSASVTELAGRYSLDARFTSVDPAGPSRSVTYTADGEDGLVGRLAELAEQVVAVVLGEDPDRVVSLRIEGAGDLEPDLRALLKSEAGVAYDQKQVAQDQTVMEAQSGVAKVTVETARQAGGVLLTFRVVRSQAISGSGVLGGSGEAVGQIRIRGNRRIESDVIRGRIKTRAGDPFNRAKVAKDVLEVQSLGFFSDVNVYAETSPEGILLTFAVEENPVIRAITVTGNESLDEDKIDDVLTITTGSNLDYPLLYENDERITQRYKQEGYYLAEVTTHVEPVSAGAVSVEFAIQEKEKLKLRAVTFEGNDAFSNKELLSGFEIKTYRWYSWATGWFDNTGTYSEPIFLRDLRSVEKMYTDDGYLQVEVSEPKVEANPEGLFVTVDIVEGPQFFVGQIEVRGDDTMDLDVLRAKVRLAEGDVFNRSFLTTDVEILERHYTDRGFFLAKVQPGTRMDLEKKQVDVEFKVEKGPLYFIRNINISGNTRTVDPVIRREMKVVEGQLYSARGLRLSQERIRRLGFFEDAAFSSQPTDDPSQLDLNVNVVERPTGSFSFGAGYSSQDGLLFTASLAQSNLFGRGYFVNLSVDVGRSTSRYFVSLSDPYFMGSRFSFSGTVFVTDTSFESFQQFQQGIQFALGHALAEDNSARISLNYSWRSREVRQPAGVNASAPIFRELLRTQDTASVVGVSFVRDTRNDRYSATEGTNLGANLEYAGLGGFSRFLRAELRGSWYLRAPSWMPKQSAFVLTTRMGYALPFNEISDWDLAIDDTTLCSTPGECENVGRLDQIDTNLKLPLTERYFLGGIGNFQLRGFRARSVGPRRAILQRTGLSGNGTLFHPVGTAVEYDNVNNRLIAVCNDEGIFSQGNGNGSCNTLNTQKISEFQDIYETDVVGGNSFIASSVEYRFGISEQVGLQGVVFVDGGNAFYEGQNMFDASQWRYGYGAGVLWFSPFGPLQLVLGFPVDPEPFEESPVFEFSVGGFGL
ncbi:MAG: outer membrane protein assembly factor BamA [Myxococcota bacterium]|nr:outer membrane protein assembly factor BamA [Myxococcota bacterium]